MSVRLIVLLVAIAFFCAIAQGVELSIIGHIAGIGTQNLSYSGDLLNVTLCQNGTMFINGSS
jgi:hypothetical protein